MKKLLLALCAFVMPALSFGAAYDVGIDQRAAANNVWERRLLVSPTTTGIMTYNPSTLLPVWVTLGQGLQVSGGVLSSTVQTGPAGPQGATGPQGPKGDPSTVPGPAGQPGSNGVSPALSVGSVTSGASPSVSLTGNQASPVLNFVLQRGEPGLASVVPGPAGPPGKDSTVPGPTGPTGLTGATGVNGVDGAPGMNGITPNLSIGTVVSGTVSSATITGSQTQPILNLTLQKGDTGPASSVPGPTGATGATGPAGASAPLPSGSVAARPLNTAFQPSATRPVLASYAVDISVTSLLLTGTQGTVSLQYADNSAMTTNLVTIDSGTNSTGGVLNVTNSGTVKLIGLIPAGKFARIATTNTTGTPTFSYRAGNETVY